MQQQFQTGFGGGAGGNPFAAQQNMGMPQQMPQQSAASNPFGDLSMSNFATEARPGPSAESWNRDMGDLGKKPVAEYKPK